MSSITRSFNTLPSILKVLTNTSHKHEKLTIVEKAKEILIKLWFVVLRDIIPFINNCETILTLNSF